MKFLKTYIFFFLALSYTMISAQTTGDFRSRQDGNWNTPASWEYYNGVSWDSPATNYPGDGIVTTNDVSIISDHKILLNIDVNNSINSLTIGDQSGTATNISTLTIGVGGNNTYNLNTNQISILYDGLMQWGGNNTLVLPAGTSIAIEKTSPYNPTTVLGTDYGLYEVGGCSTPMEIVIGGVLYSNCNGGGAPPKPPTFETVNDGGGNLSVSPTSPSPVCLGNTITLTSNPNGTGHTPGSDTITWTAITVPAGHVFTPVTGTAENTTDTPSIAGTYTYEVEIDNGTITNTGTVTIIVNTCATPKVITNRRITFRVKK